MNRREFLKRMAGFSLGAASLQLAIPGSVKAGLLTPVTDWVGSGFLDNRIRTGLKILKHEKPDWRYGETHCHSVYSDGHHTVPAILDRASNLGLDFLVITEHLTPNKHPLEYVIGSIQSRHRYISRWSRPDREPLKVYPGFEISTQQGHLILIFPEEFLAGRNLTDLEQRFTPFDRQMPTMETAARWGRALGGVSLIPHPNIERAYPFGAPTDFIRQHLTGLVDAIEDISTGHGFNTDYSRRLGLASIGSSDDHFNFLIGSTVTGYDATRYPDLLSAIRARSTEAVQVNDSLHGLIAAARTVL